ncbi:hypothetical protein LIER_13030 [Lithospermum erythrorhizon]|uniref:FHA domain-containing protein n=1 Tax=Lithospermum erythrorhizon TaxID=34254 RepID=A0AAV3PU54_LITER
METAAPVSATWTPEDDLLLKNAIEAGASLEALGKGAVRFSRRFTFKELRDRWYYLLYDPDVSAHSSVHMFELELSGFTPSSKSIKTENYKGHKDVPEKRKRNIRKQYYAMRKRLRSEFFSSPDFGFLNENIIPDCNGHGSNMREPHDGKFISDSLGLQKADLDILRNVFPETVRDYDSSALGGLNNACSAECRNTIGNDYPNRIFRNEFPPDPSLSREGERDPSVPDVKCYEISSAAKSNAPTTCKFRADNESGHLQVLPGKRLFGSFGKKQLYACDPGPDNPHSSCGFGGSQLLNSPKVEANSPLQATGCSSPQPIWKTMEDFSVPSMPVCMGNQDTAQVVATLLPDDDSGKGMRASVFDIVQSGPFLGLEHGSNNFMHAPVTSDGDFMDISDSLLNLSNEDEMPFSDVNEKEAVDKIVNDNVNLVVQSSTGAVQGEDRVKLEPEMFSGESSIILQNSPRAVQLEDTIKCEHDLVMVEELNERTPIDLHRVKMEAVPLSLLDGHNEVHNLEGNPPIAPQGDGSIPSSAVNVESRELDNGFSFCSLNTEDPDIPCNDDIFLLIHPSPVFASSTSPPFSGDAMSPPSNSKGKIVEQQMNSSNNEKDSSQFFKWHQTVKPSCSLDAHLPNPHLSSVSKSKLLDAARAGAPPANSSRSIIDSSVNKLCNATSNPSTNRLSGKEIMRDQLKDGNTGAPFLEMTQYAEAVTESAIITTFSDPEESGNDDGVPYPSDVEAVILGLDLDPPEEESCISKQAFRFPPEDTKTIVRLEQCARSCLQRTLTNQGAFAILYGRHLRQYIRKTEVVLGRSTDDLEVDIDLSKEGRANKISRRQAIIKMEVDGCFFLKNIGKGAISVNGKSVYTKQSLILRSGCLIEISRMSFAFEINQKYVRRHMDATARKITEKNKFDWSSDDIS